MALVASGNLWIEANFTETDLTYVRVGQPVTIHIDTYPNQAWKGVVDSLSPATGAEYDTFALAYTYPLSRRTNIHASLAVHRNNNEGNFGINSSATSAGTITNGSDPRAFAVGVRHTF